MSRNANTECNRAPRSSGLSQPLDLARLASEAKIGLSLCITLYLHKMPASGAFSWVTDGALITEDGMVISASQFKKLRWVNFSQKPKRRCSEKDMSPL